MTTFTQTKQTGPDASALTVIEDINVVGHGLTVGQLTNRLGTIDDARYLVTEVVDVDNFKIATVGEVEYTTAQWANIVSGGNLVPGSLYYQDASDSRKITSTGGTYVVGVGLTAEKMEVFYESSNKYANLELQGAVTVSLPGTTFIVRDVPIASNGSYPIPGLKFTPNASGNYVLAFTTSLVRLRDIFANSVNDLTSLTLSVVKDSDNDVIATRPYDGFGEFRDANFYSRQDKLIHLNDLEKDVEYRIELGISGLRGTDNVTQVLCTDASISLLPLNVTPVARISASEVRSTARLVELTTNTLQIPEYKVLEDVISVPKLYASPNQDQGFGNVVYRQYFEFVGGAAPDEVTLPIPYDSTNAYLVDSKVYISTGDFLPGSNDSNYTSMSNTGYTVRFFSGGCRMVYTGLVNQGQFDTVRVYVDYVLKDNSGPPLPVVVEDNIPVERRSGQMRLTTQLINSATNTLGTPVFGDGITWIAPDQVAGQGSKVMYRRYFSHNITYQPTGTEDSSLNNIVLDNISHKAHFLRSEVTVLNGPSIGAQQVIGSGGTGRDGNGGLDVRLTSNTYGDGSVRDVRLSIGRYTRNGDDELAHGYVEYYIENDTYSLPAVVDKELLVTAVSATNYNGPKAVNALTRAREIPVRRTNITNAPVIYFSPNQDLGDGKTVYREYYDLIPEADGTTNVTITGWANINLVNSVDCIKNGNDSYTTTGAQRGGSVAYAVSTAGGSIRFSTSTAFSPGDDRIRVAVDFTIAADNGPKLSIAEHHPINLNVVPTNGPVDLDEAYSGDVILTSATSVVVHPAGLTTWQGLSWTCVNPLNTPIPINANGNTNLTPLKTEIPADGKLTIVSASATEFYCK